jgi:diguanylate cyclase (GGDEF)-like protein
VLENLRANIFAKVHPELRHYRARMAAALLKALYVLLALWLLLTIWVSFSYPLPQLQGVVFNYIAILLLGAFGGIVWWLIRRDLVNMAGYLLAAMLYIVLIARLVLFPGDLILFSAGLMLPIIVIGVITGGHSTFYFAGASSLLVILGWLRFQGMSISPEPPFNLSSGLIFLSSQVLVHQTMAAMLYSLSQYNLRTFERLREQAQLLTHQAHTDPLTGLANRRYFIDQLQREFIRARRYKRPLSLIYIDLDGFKNINDHFGHLFGDEILKKSALTLRGVLRSADQLARIGGDEFAVLLPETTLEGARNVTSKLRKALASFSQHLGPVIPTLSFCAGVAQLREEDDSIDDLLARADEAQYRAKDAGTGETRTQVDLDQLPLFEGDPSFD